MDTLNDIISGLKWGNLDPVKAHDRVLALFGVSDWVAVDDALPNHGEEVLTITEDNWYRITQFGSIGKGKFPSQVTHWMRLPEPPCR